MTDYSELVKALRCCGNVNTDCTVCPWDKYNFGMCAEKLYTDAAAAIEELQQIADHYEQSAKDWWKEAREYKIKSAQGLTAEESKELIKRFKSISCGPIAQLPKRGEWVVFNKQMLINLENAREQYKELGYPHRTELGLQCSNCRKVTYVDSGIKYEFCPHCGAKMEVQE